MSLRFPFHPQVFDFSKMSIAHLNLLKSQIEAEIALKAPTSIPIVVQTSLDHSHKGYLRQDGRSIFYERRTEVELALSRFNYTIPHEKKTGVKSLKSDMFFTGSEYGEAISKAWNHLFENKNRSVKSNQAAINEIFTSFNK